MKIFLLFILLCSFAVADDFSFGIRSRFIDTKMEWNGYPYEGAYRSELKFPSSANINSFIINFRHQNYFFELESDIWKTFSSGTGYDSDWIINILRYKARFESIANFNRTSISLGYNYNNFDIFLFYEDAKYYYKMKNGQWIIYTVVWTGVYNEKINNLNSSYEMNYNSFGLGLRYILNISKIIDLQFKLKYLPDATIHHEGYWNLRLLRFRQKSSAERIDLYLDIKYHLYKYIYFYSGYYFSYLNGVGKTTHWTEGGKMDAPNFPMDIKSLSRGIVFGISLETAL